MIKIDKKDIHCYIFIFPFNAVLLTFLFIKESWKIYLLYRFLKNIKQHHCVQHW